MSRIAKAIGRTVLVWAVVVAGAHLDIWFNRRRNRRRYNHSSRYGAPE